MLAFPEYVSAEFEDASFSRTSENRRKCLGVARSGHVGCIDQCQTGRKFLFEHPADASYLEYRNGLPRDWTQRSDARNSRSVYVGDG